MLSSVFDLQYLRKKSAPSFGRAFIYLAWAAMAASTAPQGYGAPLPVQTLNSDASSDAHMDEIPCVAIAGKRIGVAWIAPGANSLDPRGYFGNPSRPNNNDLYFSRSRDGGLTWSTRAIVKTNVATDFFDDTNPSIATDGSGNWMVAWLSVDPMNGTIGFDADILVSVSTDDGVTWSPPAPVNTDAASDPGGFTTIDNPCAFDHTPMVVTDGQGHWVVGWVRFDNRSGSWVSSAMVATCNNLGATWSAPRSLRTLTTGEMYGLSTPVIATNRQGKWIAVWHQRTSMGSDYDIAYATSTDNGAAWTPATSLNSNASTDSGDDASPFIATDRQGNWIVTWHSSDTLGGTIGTDADILYCTSSDNGVNWTAAAPLNADAATDGTGSDTLASVHYDGTGNWVVSWTVNKQGGDNDAWHVTRPVSGTVWPAPQALNDWAATDTATSNDNGIRLGMDGEGHWMAVWSSLWNPATLANEDYDLYRITNETLVPVEMGSFSVE